MTDLHLAVALDGTGWHPAAWREPDARPADLFAAGYWVDLVQRAEAGHLDLVTIEDGLGLQSARYDAPELRVDQVRGRLDAVLLAARLAPLTRHIGLVPTATTTHTEPFHVSTALATLDYVSHGRGGWRPQVSGRPNPAFAAAIAGGFDEAADVVEVVRRLWDSWEDDAVIRDVATGRFVDRDKLHYIDFVGEHFSVKGPSIVPRPPQGQLPVLSLAHAAVPYQFAARGSDIVFVTPHDRAGVTAIIDEVRSAEAAVGRVGEPLRVWADLVVLLDADEPAARARLARLDERAGAPLVSDAAIVVGTPEQLVARLLDWRAAGLDGFRLRPAVLPHDLDQVTDAVVPLLRAAGVFRPSYAEGDLRTRLGLPVAGNRYAASV